MAFDLSTAKPVGGGFDLSTAKPVTDTPAATQGGLSIKPIDVTGKRFGGDLYSVTAPDGSEIKFTTPFKANQDQISALAQGALQDSQQKSAFQTTAKNVANILPGAVRGAASIGATLLAPYDMAKDAINGKGLSLQSNRERRQKVDYGLQDMGADPNSTGYKVGKFGAELAGTAGVGGAVANGVRAVAPGATGLAAAIESGGLASPGAGLGMRVAGGAINGAVTSGLINPEDAGKGALIGGAIPIAAKVGGVAGQALSDMRKAAANKLMNSALKPTLAQKASGDADLAVNTLLANGINPTKGGVEKLRTLIDDLNTQIADRIQNSGATVDKQKVLNALADVKSNFSNQVSPTADLNAIQGVADDFTNHPLYAGNDIPVQDAQALKQGTYRVLSKKYGQLGSAETEAQKGLARGLKDEIANAVPGVSGLNAKESDLIRTLNVTERRVLMDLNKNPMGLAALAHSPVSWAAFMADKSALFKSLAAMMVNPSGANYLPALANQSPPLLRTLANGVTLAGAEANH